MTTKSPRAPAQAAVDVDAEGVLGIMAKRFMVLISLLWLCAMLFIIKKLSKYSRFTPSTPNNYPRYSSMKLNTEYPPPRTARNGSHFIYSGEKPKKFLAMYPKPHTGIRLGNQIFQFASVVGIADINGLPACLACDHYLKTIFEITFPCVNRTEIKKAEAKGNWSEVGAGIYNKRVETLGSSKSMVVSGYLQSWKYFNHIKGIIRDQLHFKKHILDIANREIQKAMKEKHIPLYNQHVKIGIHVRRTDMLAKGSKDAGYTVANKDYLERSMSRMTSRYEGRDIVFVTCSDDMLWAKKNVRGFNVIHVQTQYSHGDLAVLSLCDAVILTTGTFGWWGAWLSGGPAIYYKDFPMPHTRIGREYNSCDYFPPWWTGM